jgi:hypothetical protein
MSKAKSKFKFYSDPGHGWLRVPYSELERLDIADKITHYSYTKGDNVFLEEDCDMSTYMRAKNALNETVDIQVIRCNRQSRIRGYEKYRGDRMVTRKNYMTGVEFQERVDTPYYCSPSSETYWSR